MPFVTVGTENGADIEIHYDDQFESTAARLRDEQLIADLTVIEVPDGPHNIGWTFPDKVNPALLEFLSR